MFARRGSRYGWQARAVSSAGRAPALQAGGRRFEPVTAHRGTPLPAACLRHAFFGLCDAARGGLDLGTRLVRSVVRPLGLARQALRLPLRLPGPLEGLPVGSGERSGLRLAQAVAGLEEEVDLPSVPPRELVERPGGDRGLPQLRERLGALAVAGFAERLRQPRALGDELLQVGGLEL